VVSGCSPLTVARPCRFLTGFPRKPTSLFRGAAFGPPKVVAGALAYLGAVRICSLACLVGLLFGCTTAVGRHSAPHSAPRLVTLVPVFADDLYAIGAGSQLVAVSAFTDAPQAMRLPRVSDSSSVDVEAIVALRPSLVIGIPAQARLTEPLRRANVPVMLLADDTYDEIFTNLLRLGTLTRHAGEARAVVAHLRRRTEELQQRTRGFQYHPKAFVVLGSAPIWTAGDGSYISTLLGLAGGKNAAADLHAAYGEYSGEALLRDQPDLIVADPATQLRSVINREPWRSLRAVRRGHVYFVNPETIERPGPNYNDGVAWLLTRIAPLARRQAP
jgi:ABC-type Fe3+-hydroxamate transport system substrate-binding protein